MRALCFVVLAACGPTAIHHACTDDLSPGDLVLSEVFPAPTGADGGHEWIEIYNAADRPVELEGLTIVHGDRSHVMRQVVIAPGQFFTLGDSAADQTLPYVDYGYADD